MISVAEGQEVARLLDRLCTHAHQYAQLIICSPYIDATMRMRLELLAKRVANTGSALWIVTSPGIAQELIDERPLHTCSRVKITGCPALHAKFYVANAKPDGLTEAIVTSANLTVRGTSSNIELGMHIDSSSESGRRMLRDINRFAKDLAA